ncbi:hypothetical protein IQ255_09405 [Pleurocapsales cyanobacterium LEGE 10410]|nr:hypothetical protein [Pleurocapsales cyanobacterium LEGE 10410]
MSKDLEILNNNDVISVVGINKAKFNSGNTFKIQQILEEFREYADNSSLNDSELKIFDNSIECEVLRQDGDKGWRKGKIKFVVQFEPDVVESNKNTNTLDDIREQIDTVN